MEDEATAVKGTSIHQQDSYRPFGKTGGNAPSRNNEDTHFERRTAELTALEQTLMREGAAHQTVKAYRSAIRMLQAWWRKGLQAAHREDLLGYLTYCIEERQYSRSTMNQVVNAIRVYYERVLKRPRDELRLPRPHKEQSLPNECTEEEARRMLRETVNRKHRMILTLIYGLGLRKAEVQHLLIEDVNLERRSVHIRKAKGNKDRILRLPESLRGALDDYFAEYRPRHWLFEGQTGGQYSGTSIQVIFTRAKVHSKLP